MFRDAFENNYGVGILRNGDHAFDLSETFTDPNISDSDSLKFKDESIVNMDDTQSEAGDGMTELVEPTHIVHRRIIRKMGVHLHRVKPKQNSLKSNNGKENTKQSKTLNNIVFNFRFNS